MDDVFGHLVGQLIGVLKTDHATEITGQVALSVCAICEQIMNHVVKEVDAIEELVVQLRITWVNQTTPKRSSMS